MFFAPISALLNPTGTPVQAGFSNAEIGTKPYPGNGKLFLSRPLVAPKNSRKNKLAFYVKDYQQSSRR